MSKEYSEKSTISQKESRRSSNTLNWQAHEYVYTRKSSDWYFKVGIITIGIIIASYILNNYLFAILAAISGFTFALFGAKKPDILNMEVSPRGVRVHTKLYPYSELDFFWVSENIEEPKILLQGSGLLHTHIILPLGDMDSEDIRVELLKYIDEEEIAEPIIHRIIDHTGF